MGNAKKMRAAIYDPYLDTGGGGERYMMTVAHTLKKEGWDVEVKWDSPKILNWLTERLGIDQCLTWGYQLDDLVELTLSPLGSIVGWTKLSLQ